MLCQLQAVRGQLQAVLGGRRRQDASGDGGRLPVGRQIEIFSFLSCMNSNSNYQI